jgi:hypothetical protein
VVETGPKGTAHRIWWLAAPIASPNAPASGPMRTHRGWIIDVGPDATDVVGVADGTDGLASMPPELVDAAAQWLGGRRSTDSR